MIKNNFFFFIMVFFLYSCVGTIETADNIETTKDFVPPVEFTFDGILSAKVVSDKKLDVYFPKAQGGSGDFVYTVYDLSIYLKVLSLTWKKMF